MISDKRINEIDFLTSSYRSNSWKGAASFGGGILAVCLIRLLGWKIGGDIFPLTLYLIVASAVFITYKVRYSRRLRLVRKILEEGKPVLGLVTEFQPPPSPEYRLKVVTECELDGRQIKTMHSLAAFHSEGKFKRGDTVTLLVAGSDSLIAELFAEPSTQAEG